MEFLAPEQSQHLLLGFLAGAFGGALTDFGGSSTGFTSAKSVKTSGLNTSIAELNKQNYQLIIL